MSIPIRTAAVVFAGLLLGACGGDEPGPSPKPGPGGEPLNPDFEYVPLPPARDLTPSIAQADPTFESTHHSGSGNCASCHNDEAMQVSDDSGEPRDVGIEKAWRTSVMANSARDPYWHAVMAYELDGVPEPRRGHQRQVHRLSRADGARLREEGRPGAAPVRQGRRDGHGVRPRHLRRRSRSDAAGHRQHGRAVRPRDGRRQLQPVPPDRRRRQPRRLRRVHRRVLHRRCAPARARREPAGLRPVRGSRRGLHARPDDLRGPQRLRDRFPGAARPSLEHLRDLRLLPRAQRRPPSTTRARRSAATTSPSSPTTPNGGCRTTRPTARSSKAARTATCRCSTLRS